MKKNIAIGVDIGGSHISCAAVDIINKKLISNSFTEKKVDNHAPADTIIKSWGQAILKTIDYIGQDKILGVGFAMPGPFDYINGISLFNGETHKFENTYGLNVRNSIKELMQYTQDIEIRFINFRAAFK